MKTTLVALCFLCATAALGQSVAGGSALSGQPRVHEFAGHTEHASQQAMAHEHSLLGTSGFAYAHGERPLWEVAVPMPQGLPLGDAARALRQEHAAAKKAEIVWAN